MGTDLAGRHGRSSYFFGCMSPSCIPVHEEYSRIRLSSNSTGNKSRKWQKLIKRLVRESKSIYGYNKPPTFQYDAISYSQNFDEGCHKEEYQYHCPHVVREFRWH
ncbi:DNA polymerase zeta catalytic subunit like [Actinidia chinensis var. chinensis]|uniref:DNA polymerase zeta catalytic subunit like n=1 Tax=Actinidia chinensis var. chinensis TaxID=1590841 RepID=A0A2R6R5A9_ACTCC|nr:DNA polymerase zeta catalytic subunit like [Actinidia chinensis var. chinensis]